MKTFYNSVGNTPLVKVKHSLDRYLNIFAKLELYNPTGSVKDRAARYMLEKLFKINQITRSTTIIESSSGNFGVALSAYCDLYGLRFICVVDPYISPINEMLIKSYGGEIVKVNEPDCNGGYLVNRIKKVTELQDIYKDSYWINQYNNRYNAEAYYFTLGNEICNEVENLEYVFIGVSSGGTITGVSNMIKKRVPNAKVIAVDVEGSVIFGNPPKKRSIPGIGSSIVPGILHYAKIDDVVIVNEPETITACRDLLKSNKIFVGGSSGSVYAAIQKYFAGKEIQKNTNVVTIFPDRGERYVNTIYDDNWVEKILFDASEKEIVSSCV